jgi:indolepyruvate ferredoxin oxidoreductase
MLGACWQRGLVPLSEAALMRAIELNGVAVEGNKTAFALGRLAIAAPEALKRLAGTDVQRINLLPSFDRLDGPEGLIARRVAFLTDYQDVAYAQRYLKLVERVRAAEAALGEAGKAERLTKAVARYYAKLLAIKDEWEVARLYTDGKFEAALKAQFEDWESLTFHMAPPLLAKPGADGRVKKIEMGSWTFKALKWMARFKGLRGTALDIFGKTEERRMERQLIKDYEALLDELLAQLSADKLDIAVQLARLPEKIRGYGHVKLANVATVRAQWKELLDRFHGRAVATAAAQPVTVQRIKSVAEL